MKHNKVSLLIGASTLAIIALVIIQVKWMQHSRKLIDEQFNHKVSMALCKAVSDLSETNSCSVGNMCSAPGESADQACGKELMNLFVQGTFNQPIDEALDFYGIDLPYKSCIIDKQEVPEEELPPYTCSLCPMGTQSHVLNVDFEGKMAYLMREMGFMLFLSILILLFICTVFVLANYHLVKQKKISKLNVDFFNNMAHEFRTPLTNINLAMTLMTKNRIGFKDNKYVAIIERECKQLMKQVEQVLRLAKLEEGEYQLNLEPIQLEEVIEQVLSDMDMQLKQKNALIDLHIGENLPPISGDPFHLRNAFRNIIDNALKYNSEKPKIAIELERSEQGVDLLIQDNGVGISKSDQAIIFNKFQRLSEGNIHHQKGFGLGLSYVKKIIEMHKGAIQLFSEVNKGSRFDLYLPAA